MQCSSNHLNRSRCPSAPAAACKEEKRGPFSRVTVVLCPSVPAPLCRAALCPSLLPALNFCRDSESKKKLQLLLSPAQGRGRRGSFQKIKCFLFAQALSSAIMTPGAASLPRLLHLRCCWLSWKKASPPQPHWLTPASRRRTQEGGRQAGADGALSPFSCGTWVKIPAEPTRPHRHMPACAAHSGTACCHCG